MPSNPSFKDHSLHNTDSDIGVSPSSSVGESLRDSRADSLQRDAKLSSLTDTDSSEPYYIKLNRDDLSSDQSPCADIPPTSLGIYNGSTSGDSTSDYEHLNFNREDVIARERHDEEEEDAENDGYGIMVMEDRIGDANPPEAWGDQQEYDHLDRGPVGRGGTRPLG